jgi:exosortase/archaeosortase family protein
MPSVNVGSVFKKLLIPLSFIIMLIVVYVFEPLSFQEIWKGRAFYLFFLWLFALELILGGLKSKQETHLQSDWARFIVGGFILMIPTIYLVEFFMFGLNNSIIGFGRFLGVEQGWQLDSSFPISFEYLIVAVSVFVGMFLLLDFEGIRQFSISISLLGLMGVFYMLDTFRPYATASFPNVFSLLPLNLPQPNVSIQGFVPFMSSMVAVVTQRLGYTVQMVVLSQTGAVQMLAGGWPFVIYWPCAGVHSLFIYTFVILLFLKGSPMSLGAKIGSLVIGAVGTFFVNILRIVSIVDISITQGDAFGQYFHNYLGELFFLFWIVIYLFALVFVLRFLKTTRQRTYTSLALITIGFIIIGWVAYFPSFILASLLASTRLIIFIAGMSLGGAGLVLGIYTYLAHIRKNKQGWLSNLMRSH